jgi:GxxExxY protein
MPIHPTLHLRSIADSEFTVVDKAVMDCAYAAHNKFGRLFDERVYENDVAARLRALGFEVHTQVPLLVEHGSFRKTYYLDLVVNHMLYELKTVAALSLEHESQALNYAILQDIRLVKLLNFGEPKVRAKLLQNALETKDRRQASLRRTGLRMLSPNCERLVAHLRELLHDWGTNLSASLYSEGLVHYFGGESHCVKRLDLHDGDTLLGTHRVQLHSEDHAFVVTSLHRYQPAYRSHLDTLLAHTRLKGIQWINLNHSRVEITTIQLATE